MEITISDGSDGKVEVRTSLGGFVTCNDMTEASVYARGLQEGYKAAVGKLGTCFGWRDERTVRS